MYIFKTSGATFRSVIENERYASPSQPEDLTSGDLILVSKNKRDCAINEKQIQYTMRFVERCPLENGQADQLWPGNEGRWKYLFICENTRAINKPFNLKDLLGDDYKHYLRIQTFGKIKAKHETLIESYLRSVHSI